MTVNSTPDQFAAQLSWAQKLYIDAGVGAIRLHCCDSDNRTLARHRLDYQQPLAERFRALGLDAPGTLPVYVTGKLQNAILDRLGRGHGVLSAAALWSMARQLVEAAPLAILELSASGYLLIGVNAAGDIHEDLLTVNPRCGAGSGVNLDRVLLKLGIGRHEVDTVLKDYLGAAGLAQRQAITVRADRCGVFASSATISDKNQGLPLSFALAVTIKSEVLKTCKKLPEGFASVWLTGGVFAWQFARDCAEDYLRNRGVARVRHDQDGSFPIDGLKLLEAEVGGRFTEPDRRLLPRETLSEYPGFADIAPRLEQAHLFFRADAKAAPAADLPPLDRNTPVLMGLDVGSTMAKVVLTDPRGETVFHRGAFSNSGDTIETIKAIFRDLQQRGLPSLALEQIGITGSARYQVRKALLNVYPQLADRILVMVENYAHALGSLDLVGEHRDRLRAAGITDVNPDFCILVDVGGEDTKISTIALARQELFDNAMNVKCSAGTGSLMDTLASMYGLGIEEACRRAYTASRGYAVNATCAVFLMENARKLQAAGRGVDEILASANWAIAENMARTLWNQLKLPARAVVLLHGQPMLSDPLPLAIACRLREKLGADVFCLVPPDPGHRACLGLTRSLASRPVGHCVPIALADFVDKEYRKRIIQCQGAACGDRQARCNRSFLTGTDRDRQQFSVALGGCSAINELQGTQPPTQRKGRDSYKELWQFIDRRMPRSDAPDRLVIPRSFAVSAWPVFFAELFAPLGIPVHVDNVVEADVLRGQPHFHIDTCAPHIGAVGQFLRLAGAPHGVILAPQIEFLPVRGQSLGRTCTINQGGIAVAQQLAVTTCPGASTHLFHLSLKSLDAESLAQQLYPRLQPVYAHYRIAPAFADFCELVRRALAAQQQLWADATDLACALGREALDEGRQVALVLGREYLLNPGVYDSHVGRLLRDQGIAGIPAYLLDVDLDPDYDHLYWRNSHLIVTLAGAAARRQLHTLLQHAGMKELFARLEAPGRPLIPLVQVSTFLCGPDSVTLPLIAELTGKRPYLLIQSDAANKELAHLENRVNTHVTQLQTGLHELLTEGAADDFEIRDFQSLTNQSPPDPQRDVIYFPTLADNRPLTAIVRAAGFTCIDLYGDGYDLQAVIKRGRRITGDGVCAPLAAVYGDLLAAREDFKRRRQNHDPLVAGKNRLLFFNSKSLGPCRLGQYVETHKIFLRQEQNRPAGESLGEAPLQFLVGLDNQGFDVGFPPTLLSRGIQSVVLQGVLHQLLAEGSTRVRNHAEYTDFLAAFAALKNDLYRRLEGQPAGNFFSTRFRKGSVGGLIGLLLSTRQLAGALRAPLRAFSRRWCQGPVAGNPLQIHVEGEVYMRIAQFEEILRTLLGLTGFRQFRLTHTPVWGFFDYKVARMLLGAREFIAESRETISRTPAGPQRDRRVHFLRKRQKKLIGLQVLHFFLRQILAAPLYRAAGIKLPESMPEVLEVARDVVSTRRPGGELVPYVGEALLKLQEGYDLVLNVAPEGCMVSSMGELLTPAIAQAAGGHPGRIQALFSQQGDVDIELLALSILKTVGPQRFYQALD
jgi:activator of 2-hydroxyglutaryl-CoA dehydratase/predicted nucleotide-binding protein (sugar kinase/HSP70/actin superfamily)